MLLFKRSLKVEFIYTGGVSGQLCGSYFIFSSILMLNNFAEKAQLLLMKPWLCAGMCQAAKWNPVVINLIIHACDFPTPKCQ